jgi:branched-chain amino acid transport system ATP-binding protein
MTERPSGMSAGESRREPHLLSEKVTSGYNKVPVIQDISVQVGLGEVVLVMGPNGAGKSTFVKAVTGKLPLMSGQLRFAGEDISELREETRAAKGIGYVPQSGDVFPSLTVTENLEMGGYRMPKREVRGRIDDIFTLFPTLAGLRRRHARTLSGGERKTLGIARALVFRPNMLILDEPTSNLSPLIAASVLHQVVEALAAQGAAILLIEQRVSLGLQVADWGYVLAEGRMRLSASGEELRSHPDLGSLFLKAPLAATETEGTEREVSE